MAHGWIQLKKIEHRPQHTRYIDQLLGSGLSWAVDTALRWITPITSSVHDQNKTTFYRNYQHYQRLWLGNHTPLPINRIKDAHQFLAGHGLSSREQVTGDIIPLAEVEQRDSALL